jgi:hypothetical protein
MGEGLEEIPAFLFYEQFLCSTPNTNSSSCVLKVDLQNK